MKKSTFNKILPGNKTQITHRVDFDSYSEFIDFCKENEGKTNNSHTDSEEKNSSFTGTRTFEEAILLAKKGYEKPLKRISKGLESVALGTAFTIEPKFDVCGESVEMGRFMSGDPENMLEWETVETAGKKVIDIYFNISASGDTNRNEKINYGICGLSAVDYLESIGMRVNLYVFTSTSGCNDGAHSLTVVKVKRADESLNLPLVAFAMCHPSMQRRFMFKSREMNPETYGYGYGFSIDMQNINDGESIVFPGINTQCDYYFNKKTDEANDIEIARWIKEQVPQMMNEIQVNLTFNQNK